MDKYELNIKLEQMRKLIKRKEYNTATKIADTIEWNRIRNNQDLLMAADVYEVAGKYVNAREVLLYAYERTNIGRQIVYRLCRVAVKLGDIVEAEEFYLEFIKIAPSDNTKYILQYEIARAKGSNLDTQINILSKYLDEDMDDKWAYELAKLYHKAGKGQDCARICDTIILWFSDGKYVEKALSLKSLYAPLTKEQQSRVFKESIIPVIDRTEEDYDAKLVLNEMQGVKVEEIQVKDYTEKVSYDTVNIQKELADSMKEFFGEEEADSEEVVNEEVDSEEVDSEEAVVNEEIAEDVEKTKEITFGTTKVFAPISKEMLQEEDESEVAAGVEAVYETVAEVEAETTDEAITDEDHIEGQLTIDEVLAMFGLEEAEEETVEAAVEEVAEEIVEEIAEEIVEEIVEDTVQEEEPEIITEGLTEELPDLTEELRAMEMASQAAVEDTVEESGETEENIVEDGEEMEEEKSFVKRELIPEAKEELKKFISRFTGVKGIDKQILKSMHSVLRTSADESNFIFIIGDVKSGKTTLAIDIIKVLNKIMENRGRKIAKVPGYTLAGKSMVRFMDKVGSSDIVVEKVSSMGTDSLKELVKAVRGCGESKIVIFEDEVITSEKFVNDICEELSLESNIIVLKQSRIKEWAEIAKEYIKEQGYEIDEMGVLAMHETIDKLHALTLVIQKNHVEQVIDRAIVKHNKRKITNLFMGNKSKILTEKDFIEE